MGLIRFVFELMVGIVKCVVNTIKGSFSLMTNSPVFWRC